MNKQNYNIDEIINLINKDNILIPKGILKTKVSENSKLMFSVIFTECVNKQRVSDNISEISEQVYSFMKEKILHITYLEIINECSCDRKRAKKIKRELERVLKPSM